VFEFPFAIEGDKVRRAGRMLGAAVGYRSSIVDWGGKHSKTNMQRVGAHKLRRAARMGCGGGVC
jgi:hypothetical protein